MSKKIDTNFGEPIPPFSDHAVTFHIGPSWDQVEAWSIDRIGFLGQFQILYPRMRPHHFIDELSAAVLERLGEQQGNTCHIYLSLQSAGQCIGYATSSERGQHAAKAAEITMTAFVAKDLFYAIVFPTEKLPVFTGFWTRAGVGATSRFAEANLGYKLRELPMLDNEIDRTAYDGPQHRLLRENVLAQIDRTSSDPPRGLSTGDIYLFPSGMASIVKPHMYMTSKYHGTSVLFGMAFAHTIDAFEQIGAGSKFFGKGTDEELDQLEAYLRARDSRSEKVQAIWVEFPGNPLLNTSDLNRIHKLANEHDIVLAVDDTIGSWANIDLLPIADILVTSLSKSFNGYADALGGVAVLNPSSPKYSELKPLFESQYVPEMFEGDAATIERNSHDYLSRSARLNRNALAVVEYLHSCAQDPESAVWKVCYPTTNPSGIHYKGFMRPTTPDFEPGYGCMFNVELRDYEATKAFYDNLNVHKGVHLGAPLTLAFAYTMAQYGDRFEWAAEHGLRKTQIRVSVGLEDTNVLLEDFRVAVEAADKVSSLNYGLPS